MKKTDIFFTALLSAAVLLLPAGTSLALDPESIQCLSCHDGALAQDPNIMTVCSEPDCDHPIGLDYVTLASTNLGLRPPYMLDPAIRLVDGSSIGCGTCHVSYSVSNHSTLSALRAQYPAIPDAMLTMDNRVSELCFGCHYK